jgi:hypothetical protein
MVCVVCCLLPLLFLVPFGPQRRRGGRRMVRCIIVCCGMRQKLFHRARGMQPFRGHKRQQTHMRAACTRGHGPSAYRTCDRASLQWDRTCDSREGGLNSVGSFDSSFAHAEHEVR